MPLRVGIIGCGPCGMSALYHFGKMQDDKRPDIVCFEKQSTWGGLWNFTWKIGTDEYGEHSHSGMYHNLWSNGPKECLEYPDYTFDDRFRKAIPSFPPREVLRKYLEGRLQQTDGIDLKQFVRFSTVVRRVEYHEASDDFTVISKNLITDKESLERFTHIIVATGIFSIPQLPSIEGLDEFPGRILHAHDFKNAEEFKGQKILVVGASYSAEDLALQTLKFGAKKVTTCWRTNPMGFEWPAGIDERPLVTKFEGQTAYFKDGSKDDYDSVLLCTGYKKYYPFLPDDLRLTGGLSLYPPNLYKGTVWLNGGNGKLLYLGTQDQYYTFTMFDVQALWACRYITGPVNCPTKKEMKEDAENWQEKVQKLKDCHDEIDFQTEFLMDLGKAVDYSEKAGSVGELFHEWEHQKYEEICTYRDKSFRSVFSGTLAPRHHTTWMEAKDDTYDTFVDQTPNKF